MVAGVSCLDLKITSVQAAGTIALPLLAVLAVGTRIRLAKVRLLGQLVVTTYYETRDRPTYVLREILG